MATADDPRSAIVQAVHDYFEGWFDADVGRMSRALHPDLVKRSPRNTPDAPLGITTKARMLELTAAGEGKEDADDRHLDVEVTGVHRGIASVTVRSAAYHEYLHLVQTADGWKIANALWERP